MIVVMDYEYVIYYGEELHHRTLSLRATLPFNSWSPLIG